MKNRHPEPAEIAALAEGLLPPQEAASLRDHLRGCSPCAGTAAELETLRQDLASLYPATPMPDDVAARIDGALAAERETSPVSRETGHRRRWPHMMLVAAGALAVLGMGGILVQSIGGSSGSSAYDETAAGAVEDPLEREVRLLLAGEVVEEFASEDSSAEDSPESAAEDGGLPTATLEGQDEDGDDEGREAAGSLSGIPVCVLTAIGRSEHPLASSPHYVHEGTESYLVVLPHSGNTELVDAYVVDASCLDGTPAVSDHVLVMQSYPRA